MGTSSNIQQPGIARTQIQQPAAGGVGRLQAAPSMAQPAPIAAAKQHPAASLQAFKEAWRSASSGGALAQWAGAAWAGDPNKAHAETVSVRFNEVLKNAEDNFDVFETLAEAGKITNMNLDAKVLADIDAGAKVFKGLSQAHEAYKKAMQKPAGSIKEQWASAQLLRTARETLNQAQASLKEGNIFSQQDVKNLNVIINQLKTVSSNTARQFESSIEATAPAPVRALFSARNEIANQMVKLNEERTKASKSGQQGVARQCENGLKFLRARQTELMTKLGALINEPPPAAAPPRQRTGVFNKLSSALGRIFRSSDQTRQAAAGAPLQVPRQVGNIRPALAAQVKGVMVAAGAPAGVALPSRQSLERQMAEAEARVPDARPPAASRQGLIIDDKLAAQFDQMVKLEGLSRDQSASQRAAALKEEYSKLNFKIPDGALEGLSSELAELDEEIMNEAPGWLKNL